MPHPEDTDTAQNQWPSRYSLNWQLCSKELDSINLVAGMAPKSILFSIGRFFFGAVRSCAFLFRPKAPKNVEVLLFVSSANQYDAVKSIRNGIDSALIIEMVNPFSTNADAYFPLYRAYFKALFDIKSVLNDHRSNADDYRKKAYQSRGDLLALAPGLLCVAISYLRRAKPQVVVVSNDLVLWTRAIIFAAKYLGIKTVYLQHACVSNIVPPLEVSFAFLDGSDAAEKYIAATRLLATKIYLPGGARHDPFVRLDSTYKHLARVPIYVGLCVNMVDDLHAVKRIASMISRNDDMVLTIRPHPREPRVSALKAICNDLGSGWSDPSDQSTVRFIAKHDSILAGDSSILLEAALGKRKAIAIQEMGAYDDYLGLIKNGVVSLASNEQELLSMLSASLQVSKEGLRRYYAPSSTDWEGHSSELLVSALHDISENVDISHECWAQNSGRVVFTLKNNTEILAK